MNISATNAYKYLIYAILPASLAHGFLSFHFRFEMLQTLFFAAILASLLLISLQAKISRKLLATFIIFIAIYAMSSLVSTLPSSQSIAMENGAIWNARFFARSILMALLSFLICSTLFKKEKSTDWIIFLSFYTWLVIFASIIAHIIFGIGGATGYSGQLRDSHTSFFTAGNAIVYVFLSSWLCLHHLYFSKRSLKYQLIFYSSTTAILIAMDSKSALIISIILLVLNYWKPLSRNQITFTLISIYICVFVALIAIINLSQIIDWTFNIYISHLYKGDIDKLQWRMEEWDAFRILVGSRDYKFTIFYENFSNASLMQYIFGGSFGAPIATRFIESDPLDIFYALGIAGIFVYGGVYLYFLRKAYLTHGIHQGHERLLLARSLLLYILLQSTATGHILTEQTAMLYVGIHLAFISQAVDKRNLKPINPGTKKA